MEPVKSDLLPALSRLQEIMECSAEDLNNPDQLDEDGNCTEETFFFETFIDPEEIVLDKSTIFQTTWAKKKVQKQDDPDQELFMPVPPEVPSVLVPQNEVQPIGASKGAPTDISKELAPANQKTVQPKSAQQQQKGRFSFGGQPSQSSRK